MPVFSCGGMRYQYKWGDVPPEEIPADNQANLEATIHRAIEVGVNHIETARGYGSSEMQLGWVLPKLPRETLIVQTKVAPSENPADFLANFEKSMAYLKLDYVDLLAFHGVNDAALLDQVLRKGGCLEVARKLQRDGRVRFVGFSTHATCPVITAGCASGEFDYVNLHWYWINQSNGPAVEAAVQQDMGVFIISPVDKGGRLYDPPQKLVDLCAPLSPIQFNDLFCLSHPEVHTLSVGAARPSDFDDHVAALAHYETAAETIAPIEARLRAALVETHGADWAARWSDGLPEFDTVPGEVHVAEILRLYTYAAALDMDGWARSRYNLLGNGGHWFPGQNAARVDDAALAPSLAASPFAAQIPEVLRKAHALLGGESVKRLSQGG